MINTVGAGFDFIHTNSSIASDVISSVKDIWGSLGRYCVEWINGALKVFRQLVWSAKDMLTFDTSDSTFSGFARVVDRASGVLTIIASSLIVMFFLTGLASDTWETRHDFDLWTLVKDLVKLIVSTVVINNSLKITKTIFNCGAAVAEYMTVSDSLSSAMTNPLELNTAKATYLIKGVSGVRGVFLLAVYVMGAAVIVMCAVIITIEIYQRIFRIYILIPCSTLAFSTFVIGSSGQGREVFAGYIKNIVQTALEAFIIMLAISYTYMLCDNSAIMNKLFPADVMRPVTVAAYGADDILTVRTFIDEYSDFVDDTYNSDTGSNGFAAWMQNYSSDGTSEIKLYSEITYEDISPSLLSALDGISGSVAEVSYKLSGGSYSSLTEKTFSKIVENPGETTRMYFKIYSEVGIKDALMLLVQILFPCVLCAGAVKTAGQYAGMVIGK